MPEAQSFGRWVKDRRKALDLTQAALGERVGCAGETIRRLEAGRLRPSRQIAERLAEHLGLPLEERHAFVQAARITAGARQPLPMPDATPTLPSPPLRRPAYLPAPLTPLIGRTVEAAAVCHLMESGEARLLTLVGSPGVGKTRLALLIASQLEPRLAHGVAFIELAALQNTDLVTWTIAHALGIVDVVDQQPLERLQAYVRTKELLLVLDNFEHVLAAAPDVTALLQAAPHLTVLVTSRTPLHVYGEYEYHVPPLAVPSEAGLSVHDLGGTDAVQLFAARARAVDVTFQLAPANVRVVTAICRRLDGLPLAIELAAARIRQIPLPILLTRLHKPLETLVHGPRDLSPRQQTLANAIGWSYALLNRAEQQLFARLSVFPGGCTPEVAAAVCGIEQPCHEQADGAAPNMRDVMTCLSALVANSLLHKVDFGNEIRFRMLETIREYAVERLTASDEAELLRTRLATTYVTLAEAAEAHVFTRHQRQWLDRLEREHANMRAVLEWAAEHRAIETSLRLGAALVPFWYIRGYLTEGRRWLDAALASGVGPASLRIRALNGASLLAVRQADYTQAVTLAETSLTLARESSDDHGRARALLHLGVAQQEKGEFRAAVPLLEESWRRLQALNDTWGTALALYKLGIVATELGDLDTAAVRYEESLNLRRQLGATEDIAWTLNGVGNVAAARGNITEGIAMYQESLSLRREVGDRYGIAWALFCLGDLHIAHGKFEEARALLTESLALQQELEDPWSIACSLERLGTSARQQGDYGRASALLEESLTIRQAIQDSWGVVLTLCSQGELALAMGDVDQGMRYFLDSLSGAQQLGLQRSVVSSLVGLAKAAVRVQDWEHAAHLFGAAQARCNTTRYVIVPVDRAALEQELSVLRSAWDERLFHEALADGATMPFERLLGVARGIGKEA